MILVLDSADAQRFGCAERLDFDPMDLSLADMAELSERFSFDIEDWPYPLQGEIPLEQAGNEDAQPKAPKWQMWCVAWLALRQNGVDVSWEEAGKAKIFRMRIEREPGKDQPDSPSSDDSTTPPSGSSSD